MSCIFISFAFCASFACCSGGISFICTWWVGS